MRTRFSWLAVVVLLGLAAFPWVVHAQATVGEERPWLEEADPGFLPVVRGQMAEVPPPAHQAPLPFGRPRMELGGFYFAGEFMYWRQTNPLKGQNVAYRGIQDADGTIGLVLGIGSIPGQWIGSKVVALDTEQISGPNNWAPGFNFTVGYKFESGTAIEMRWIHLFDQRYSATAGLLPPTTIGLFAEETFITSPVYNFSPDYFGPGNTTGNGSAIALFGIWDGSSLQTIDFVQRYDQWDLNLRVPIHQSDCWRTYGLGGPRIVTMWERFKRRTVHPEADGTVLAEDVAIYSNVTSNRLYGVHLGVGNEWFLGDTPVGGFAISLDVQGAFFFDFVKGRPKYEISDGHTAASHARNFYSFVPEIDGALNLWWYPYEGIVFRFGYEAQAFFNTYSSPRPIDFNFGSITPAYERTFRLFDGFNFGFGVVF